MIEAIDHINIKTSDIHRTTRFYCALFDLVAGPALTMADQTRNFWLSTAAGDAVIHVNHTPEPTELAARNLLDHVAFRCHDIDAMRQRLDNMGVSHDSSESPALGLTQIFFRDPDGLKIELLFRA